VRQVWQKVLVTGADGFIGSHLVEGLVQRGYNVKAFVLYNSFNSWGWLDRSPQAVRESVEVFAGDNRISVPGIEQLNCLSWRCAGRQNWPRPYRACRRG
jgi:nucleoside-diphosphate-sugar epimerase